MEPNVVAMLTLYITLIDQLSSRPILILLVLTSSSSFAQLIVNDANVSRQEEKKYIQFMYYVEKGSQKPVYFIDHGITEVDVRATQKIRIDNIDISSDMSPMLVLNLLYKSGWEYMGDMHYQREPMTNNFHVYTLRRRDSGRHLTDQ